MQLPGTSEDFKPDSYGCSMRQLKTEEDLKISLESMHYVISSFKLLVN